MKKGKIVLGAILCSVLLSACSFDTGKTDGIMVELQAAGYVQAYDEGEKIIKYDGVVPKKQVYYEYPITDHEFNQTYRIYFEEGDDSRFKFYDRAQRIWYRFEVDGNGKLTELERHNY